MIAPLEQQDETLGDILIPTDTIKQKIHFIIERKTGIPSLHYLNTLTEQEREDLLNDWDKEDWNVMCSKLEALREDELIEIYKNERYELQREIELYLKPADATEYEQWLVMETWLPAEALCLWRGTIPRFGVDLREWAERNRRLAPAAAEVGERWDLIERALKVGVLSEPIDPKTFMQWAVKTKSASPTVFSADTVDERSNVTPASNGLEPKSEISRLKKEISRLKKENDRLGSRLEELDQPHYVLSVKLFGALCVGIYGFDIESAHNTATAIITKVVSEHWNGRDVKTVRDYIRSSVQALPQGEKKYAKLNLSTVPADEKSAVP